MVFSSSIFLFIFLPLVIIGYFLLRGRLRNLWLLGASLFFYAWGEPRYILLMIFSIILNYFFGRFIENRKGKIKKLLLAMAVTVNLLLLGYFKYFNFIMENINHLLDKNIQVSEVALPIGISFYTFQIISYVIDVYRGEVKAQKNILHLALYISLFPQLIAGPIVRYVDVEKQIQQRSVSLEKAALGMRRFMFGFSKKILIADQVCKIADYSFGYSLENLPASLAWTGAVAYALQIYFDFSGYSDMAIGLGKIFGFDFLENFDYPYSSKSIKEFWRRWHISLSSWFRDYLYIPLGGNRISSRRTYLNLLIVFMATGIWHGANWTFLFWGLFHGIFLILERGKWGKIEGKMPDVLKRLYMIVVVITGWVFFRADSIEQAGRYLAAMFSFRGGVEILGRALNAESVLFLLLGVIFSIPVTKKWKNFFQKNETGDMLANGAALVLFFTAVCYMVGSGFSPFLYFRF